MLCMGSGAIVATMLIFLVFFMFQATTHLMLTLLLLSTTTGYGGSDEWHVSHCDRFGQCRGAPERSWCCYIFQCLYDLLASIPYIYKNTY